MFNPLEGEILYIDKPLHWTSFDAVKRVRSIMSRRLKIKKIKVGHAGTLDPLATGVMIVCTGKATKRIDELQAHTKEYVATIALGATTPSYDLETEIDATYSTEHITREMVEEVLKKIHWSHRASATGILGMQNRWQTCLQNGSQRERGGTQSQNSCD